MILFLVVFADVFLRLSTPGAISVAGLIAFLSLLTSLALLFVRTVDWSAGSFGSFPVLPAAALAVGLYGLHPATIASVKGDGKVNLVASLTGIAAGIVICRWKPARWWHRWAGLLPAIPCIVLHRAGAGFAPLLAASVWLSGGESEADGRWRNIGRCWPALIVSGLAGFLNRGDGFHPGASTVALPAIVARFLAPFATSLGSGWNTADGLASLAAAGIILAAAGVFRLPAVSFGLFWFLVMAFLAPAEPLAALPGLALATMAALAAASTPLLDAHRSGLKADG